MAIIKAIQNALGLIVYPITLTKAIYDDKNVRLDSRLSTIDKSIEQVATTSEENTKKLAGLTFGQDAKGNWGYKPSGADSVIPFQQGEEYVVVSKTVKLEDVNYNEEVEKVIEFTLLSKVVGIVEFSGNSKQSSTNYHVRVNDLSIEGNKVKLNVGSYHNSYRYLYIKVIGVEK